MSASHRRAVLGMAVAAGLLFGWAIAPLWVGFPALSPAALHANALVLLFLWAIGPAVWFVVERRLWSADTDLETCQQVARDFWIGGGAIVVLLAARTMMHPFPSDSTSYVINWKLVVDVIRIIAWPVLAAVGFVLFREPLSAFFRALGSRTSKIGAFSVTVELASLPEARPWSGPRLDDLKQAAPMAAGDSSGSLFRAIAETANADYITVGLGEGTEWLTSRLFILATLIPRVRSIKRIVFFGGKPEKFLGHASPGAVAEALALKYRWLEEAYVGAHVSAFTNNTLLLAPNKSLLGQVDPQVAREILSQYLTSVKGAGPTPEWVSLGATFEHAAWVTPAGLQELLQTRLETSGVARDPAIGSEALAKTVLRHEPDYVAVHNWKGDFAYLVDRQRALDQVVRRELG